MSNYTVTHQERFHINKALIITSNAEQMRAYDDPMDVFELDAGQAELTLTEVKDPGKDDEVVSNELLITIKIRNYNLTGKSGLDLVHPPNLREWGIRDGIRKIRFMEGSDAHRRPRGTGERP